MRVAGILLIASAVLVTVPAAAEEGQLTAFGIPVEARPGDPPVDAFGPGLNTSVIQVSQWQEVQSGTTWVHTLPGYLNVTATNASPNLYAPLTFDQGVEITQVCAQVFDASPSLAVAMVVGAFESADNANPPDFVVMEAVTTGTTAAPGYTLLCATVDPVIRIRTDADIHGTGGSHTVQYWVGFTMPVSATDTALGPAVVTWQRTVSPAPVTATFNDVPTSHPFFQFIEALAASGITGGCGGGNYCPDNPLTRGQVAVFLAKALGLHWPN